MRPALFALLLCSFACADGQPGAEAQRSDPLRGGDADAGAAYPQVFIVRMRFDNMTQFACTATLITPRTLLLAAHCFDATSAGATSMIGAWATNLSPGPPSADPRWIPLVQTRQHPSWTRSNPSIDDIAFGLLDDDAGVPLPTAMSPYLNRPLTAADVGQPLEVVGYGITARGNTDQGTRRAAVLPLASLTADHINLGDMNATGLCNGDSGGPSLLRGRDGVARVAGIHSYDSSLVCNYGQDTRVDLFGAFIRQWIMDTGGPTCAEDGLCKSGCTPADVDCACVADGTCSAACPNPLTDPDCSADCGANGVCATTSCGSGDPDCVAELSACTQATQCTQRVCAADPQRGGSYCSQPCSAAAPCPASLGATSCVGGVCLKEQLPAGTEGQPCTVGATFCTGGTACTGLVGDQLRCLRPCRTSADCGAAGTCVTGQNSTLVCQPLLTEGTACTRGVSLCAGTLVCGALGGDLFTCVRPCTGDGDCKASELCDIGQFGQQLCRPRPVQLRAAGEEKLPAAAGCTAASGAPLAWALALVIAARRVRR